FVETSASSGPSKIVWESGKPRALSTVSKTARAAAERSARALPIPTRCDPWPGKTQATSLTTAHPLHTVASPTHHRRAPGQPGAEADEDHVHPRPQGSGLY